MTTEELKDFIEKLAISQAKTDEQLKKTDEQLKKTDEQLKKTDEQLKKTDEELKKSNKAFDIRMQKLDKKLEKIGKMVGSVSNNQGNVAEEYFVNSLKDYLKIGNLDFDYLIPNFKAKKGNKILAEYDILLVNGESVAIVEVKYKAHSNDIKALPKKVEQLKRLPQYKNYKVYAGIATFFATDELIKKAKESGYFVLQRKGKVITPYVDNLKAA